MFADPVASRTDGSWSRVEGEVLVLGWKYVAHPQVASMWLTRPVVVLACSVRFCMWGRVWLHRVADAGCKLGTYSTFFSQR